MASLQTLLVGTLTHLLGRENWARERLRPFAGALVRIDGGPFTVALRIDAHGMLVAGEANLPATVTLTLPSDTPWRLLVDRQGVFAGVRLAGSAEVAEALAFVFRHLRWDIEEDLARLVGDIPARRMVLLGRHLGREAGAGAQRLLANVTEYATEESGMLVARRDIEDFARDVEQLHDVVAGLEKRLQRM
jgi:ubiquinone biosynthesis protein UbiJ